LCCVDAINTFRLIAGCFTLFRIVSGRQIQYFRSSRRFIRLVRFPAAPQGKAGQGQKPWPAFFFIDTSSRIAWVRWSRRTYEQRDRAGADAAAALVLKEFGLFPAG
jgi:hypothetical protein